MYSKIISCVLFRSRRPRGRIYLLFIYRCEDSYEEYQRLALFQELFSFVGSRVLVALSVSPIFSPRNSLLQRSPVRLLTTFRRSRVREFLRPEFSIKISRCFFQARYDFRFLSDRISSVPIGLLHRPSVNQPNSPSSSLSRMYTQYVLFQLSPRSFGTNVLSLNSLSRD